MQGLTKNSDQYELLVAPARALLKQRLPMLKAIYVFGSVAAGASRPDSDLDLAVLTDHPLANRLIRLRQLGIPQSSRDSFVLLEKTGLLDNQIAENMQKMVGFHNVAVHDYQALNLDIVVAVVTTKLDDFRAFSAAILKLEKAH